MGLAIKLNIFLLPRGRHVCETHLMRNFSVAVIQVEFSQILRWEEGQLDRRMDGFGLSDVKERNGIWEKMGCVDVKLLEC